jgi:hypothetical protein
MLGRLGTLGVIDCVVVNRRFIHTSSMDPLQIQFFFEFDKFRVSELALPPYTPTIASIFT